MTHGRYSDEEKQIAYALDPLAWRSYSGKHPSYKRAMETRRNNTLAEARRISQDPYFVIFGINPYKAKKQTNAEQFQARIQKANADKVHAALDKAQEAITKRQAWITSRRNQQEKLAELAEEMLDHYRRYPHDTGVLNEFTKEIQRVAHSGCYDRY